MKKYLLIFSLLLVSVIGFSQMPKFEADSIKAISGQSVYVGVKVYNLPLSLGAITVVATLSQPVDAFYPSGMDEARWPGLLENFSIDQYRMGWFRNSSNWTINNSIQDYENGEVMMFFEVKPKYNTIIKLDIEIADNSGNVIPIIVRNGYIDINVTPPIPVEPWKCGDKATINGKQYGTKYLETNKVCVITENYDDGKSFVFQGQPTGQYVAKDWKEIDGWRLPDAATYKEMNVPSTKVGYKITKLSDGTPYPYKTNRTLYITNATTVNRWRYFYCPETPTKLVSDSNSPSTGFVRLVKVSK